MPRRSSPSSSTRTSARRSGWATSCSGPRVTAFITARGVHQYNYSDLPLFDILFGTFRNPKDFVSESGFYDGASAKVPEILLFKDIAGSDFDPAMRLGRQ